MDSSNSIDTFNAQQNERISKITQNGPLLDETIKQQFSRHLEWLQTGEGWHPIRKTTQFGTLWATITGLMLCAGLKMLPAPSTSVGSSKGSSDSDKTAPGGYHSILLPLGLIAGSLALGTIG